MASTTDKTKKCEAKNSLFVWLRKQEINFFVSKVVHILFTMFFLFELRGNWEAKEKKIDNLFGGGFKFCNLQCFFFNALGKISHS